ncbi:hypothetical protein [Streptomyces sp. NPDC058664]
MSATFLPRDESAERVARTESADPTGATTTAKSYRRRSRTI